MRFPVSFFKAGPAEYVVKFVAGERWAAGKGKIFLVGPRTAIVRVPATEIPIPFAFTELTADGQEIVVQGELIVRYIVDTIIERFDFTVDLATSEYEYASEDPEKAREEAIHAFQEYVRREVRTKGLKDALASAVDLQAAVLAAIRANAEAFTALGIEIRNFFVTAVTPANLDLKRALEAAARERMLADADKALADRRMDAATNDRALKEYEAETAEGLERRRAALVEARNANVVAEAEADAAAIAKRLAPYEGVDAKTLFALGIRELGTNGRVGQVNFTPDFLAAVQNGIARDGK